MPRLAIGVLFGRAGLWAQLVEVLFEELSRDSFVDTRDHRALPPLRIFTLGSETGLQGLVMTYGHRANRMEAARYQHRRLSTSAGRRGASVHLFDITSYETKFKFRGSQKWQPMKWNLAGFCQSTRL